MEKALSIVMDIGEQMLTSGAEVHRVEESICKMLEAFGAKRTDVFIITSSMVVTVFFENGSSLTQTRRITSSSIDFEKLHKLNSLSRKICAEKPFIEVIEEDFSRIQKSRGYPFYLECLCYALIAGAFTLFFGGTLIEASVSLVVGALVRIFIELSKKAVFNNIFSKFLSSAIASLLAFIALKTGLISNVDKIIIGNIMTLIPGIGLTNAIRDLFTGDSIAGLLRSIEAVLTALAIAAGYFLISVFGGFSL